MIGVIVNIKTKDGKWEQFEEISKKLVDLVNSEEKDNIFYRLYRRSENLYTFMEGYKNKEALEYHTTTTHYKENSKAMTEFLDGRPEVEVMEEMAPSRYVWTCD